MSWQRSELESPKKLSKLTSLQSPFDLESHPPALAPNPPALAPKLLAPNPPSALAPRTSHPVATGPCGAVSLAPKAATGPCGAVSLAPRAAAPRPALLLLRLVTCNADTSDKLLLKMAKKIDKSFMELFRRIFALLYFSYLIYHLDSFFSK